MICILNELPEFFIIILFYALAIFWRSSFVISREINFVNIEEVTRGSERTIIGLNFMSRITNNKNLRDEFVVIHDLKGTTFNLKEKHILGISEVKSVPIRQICQR